MNIYNYIYIFIIDKFIFKSKLFYYNKVNLIKNGLSI